MKKLILISFAVLAVSCSNVKRIGVVQVVSTKAIPNASSNYTTIANPDYKKRQIKKNACLTIDDSIDKELSKYPGATHLVNAKIYMVEGVFRIKYSVVGEVVKSK